MAMTHRQRLLAVRKLLSYRVDNAIQETKGSMTCREYGGGILIEPLTGDASDSVSGAISRLSLC